MLSVRSSSAVRLFGLITFTSAVLSMLSFIFLDLDQIVDKLGLREPNRRQGITSDPQDSRRPPPYGVDADTVALWTFDEDRETVVRDSVGRNSGATTGSTGIAGGLFGRARSFGGAGRGDYVTIPDDPSLNILGPVTVEMWVLPISFDLGLWNQSEDLLNKGGHWHVPGHARYGLSVTRNGTSQGGADRFRKLRFSFQISVWSDNSSICACASSSAWHGPGRWYYVVGTYDGRRARLYVNGALEAESGEVEGLTALNREPLFINNHTFFEGRAQSAGRFGGLVDEVRISRKARTAQEIQRVYAEVVGTE